MDMRFIIMMGQKADWHPAALSPIKTDNYGHMHPSMMFFFRMKDAPAPGSQQVLA